MNDLGILYVLVINSDSENRNQNWKLIYGLRKISYCPQNLLQIKNPLSTFIQSKRKNLLLGYELAITNYILLDKLLDNIDNSKTIVLIFEKDVKTKFYLAKLDNKFNTWFYSYLQNVFDNSSNCFEDGPQLYKKISKDKSLLSSLPLNYIDRTFFKNNEYLKLNIYNNFRGNLNNFLLLNQITGAFWANTEFFKENEEGEDYNPLDKKKLRRRERIIEKCVQLDLIQIKNKNIIKEVHFVNPVFDSLILSVPFHNPRIKDFVKVDKKNKFEKFQYDYLTAEQLDNYTYKFTIDDELLINGLEGLLKKELVFKAEQKILLLDLFSFFHASYQYSPVIRLPLVGKSVNKELSYFKPTIFREKRSLLIEEKRRINVDK